MCFCVSYYDHLCYLPLQSVVFYRETILVNRGWIPQSMRPKEKRLSSMINSEIELVGVVRLTEKRAPFMPKNHPEKGSWFYR